MLSPTFYLFLNSLVILYALVFAGLRYSTVLSLQDLPPAL